jgi:predicted nicotinamide N-methyase
MSIAAGDARAFIRQRLPLQPAPGELRIRLHLAGPSSGLGRLADEIGVGARAPYWAFAWAGGLVLASYILDHPEEVAGRRALDLGTGGGLVAIAAALAGAAAVQAVDIDPLALVAAELNAGANGVALSTRPADPSLGLDADVDVVCAGDIFYDAETAEASLAMLRAWRGAGARILIGDPWRRFLPAGSLRLLAEGVVQDFGAAAVPAGVFTLAE